MNLVSLFVCFQYVCINQDFSIFVGGVNVALTFPDIMEHAFSADCMNYVSEKNKCNSYIM